MTLFRMNIFNFKNLLQENDNMKLNWYTWLVFLENSTTNIFHHDLKIPIDSVFIIIEKIHHNFYKLREIYGYKKTSFSFDFGTWYDMNLNVTVLPLFKRRSNLNGSEITTLSPRASSENVSNNRPV